jgi:hypothetical protein
MSATVKEAVADAEVQILQEDAAEARLGTPGPRTRRDGRPDSLTSAASHWELADGPNRARRLLARALPLTPRELRDHATVAL